MIYCYDEIDGSFDTKIDKINTIVIENRNLFRAVVQDIYNRIDGLSGKSVLGTGDGKLLDFSKYAEIFTSFVPFEINRKGLITKITSAVEKESLSGYRYESTMKILTDIERYMEGLTSSFDCNLAFSKITAGALIKAVGIEIVDDYTSLGEKIIDYMELVREFDKEKIFFTVNFRSFVDDEETEEFMKTVKIHDFHLVMFENKEYNILEHELRRTIDEDLCEF